MRLSLARRNQRKKQMNDKLPYQSLASAKREKNVEEPIPHVDEAIKQSDVLDHLKSVTDNGAEKP